MDTHLEDKLNKNKGEEEMPNLAVHITDEDLGNMEKLYSKDRGKDAGHGLDKEASDYAQSFAKRWESCGFKPISKEAEDKSEKEKADKQKEAQSKIRSIMEERMEKYKSRPRSDRDEPER